MRQEGDTDDDDDDNNDDDVDDDDGWVEKLIKKTQPKQLSNYYSTHRNPLDGLLVI